MDERIEITDSIFRQKPTIKFAETMEVSHLFWENMWYRYKYQGYSPRDLKEWFELKSGKKISRKTIYRWILRQEIYDDAKLAVKCGAKVVNIKYFKRNQSALLDKDVMDSLK